MYGRKVKLRFLFVVIILITLILTTFLILKSLEENVVYFQSPSEIKSLNEIYKSKIRFLVFGRLINEKFMELKDLDIPKALLDCCDSVPQNLFRNDVSSTKIRKSNSPSSSQ